MTTITVPINAELQQFIEEEIESGKSETKAHVVRYALMRLKEERGLERLMEAEADIKEGRIYQGSLRDLAKKIK
jgi:Arc/MetJ-type ribon-helix-helix transcriptional regulator